MATVAMDDSTCEFTLTSHCSRHPRISNSYVKFTTCEFTLTNFYCSRYPRISNSDVLFTFHEFQLKPGIYIARYLYRDGQWKGGESRMCVLQTCSEDRD